MGSGVKQTRLQEEDNSEQESQLSERIDSDALKDCLKSEQNWREIMKYEIKNRFKSKGGIPAGFRKASTSKTQGRVMAARRGDSCT